MPIASLYRVNVDLWVVITPYPKIYIIKPEVSTNPQVAQREKKDSLHIQQRDALTVSRIHELPIVFSEPFVVV